MDTPRSSFEGTANFSLDNKTDLYHWITAHEHAFLKMLTIS